MKRILLTFIIAFAASIGSMIYAEIYEGSCSETVFWKFDSQNGLLTIYGEGEIPYYSEEEGGVWTNQISVEDIYYVIIEEGITRIGNYAFMWHSMINAAQIASSVTSIGHLAFGYCSSLQTVVFKGATPPSRGDCIFCEIGEVGVFYVPVGSIDAYRSAGYGYDCETFEEGAPDHLVPNPKVYTQLDDTTVCYGSYITIGNCGQYIYSNRTISCTITTEAEVDSIITQNVYVKYVQYPDYSVKHEYDQLNTGAVTFTTTEYTNCDYFTFDGKRYDVPPIGESIVIDNLSRGQYIFKAYSECDSASLTFNINRYAMEVDGLYYTFKESGEATVSYRGESYYSYNEYVGDVVIPKKVTFNDTEYTVTRIGINTFWNCSNLLSVTIPASITYIGDEAFYNCPQLATIYCLGTLVPTNYGDMKNNITAYVPIGCTSVYKSAYGWRNLNIQPAVRVSHKEAPTSCVLNFEGFINEIVACAVEDGEKKEGHTLELIGLEPNREYANSSFEIYAADDASEVLNYSFKTSALELTTLESKPVNNTTAILLAATNISELETNCGFEWKRNDAPADMNAKKEYAFVSDGLLCGRLRGLREDVYYKYRAFYETSTGQMYYGDWQYIFTGDAGVEFDPILYTEAAAQVKENEATLRGYALPGAEEFTEQGFEYWVESRVRESEQGAAQAPAANYPKQTVQGEGVYMEVTLTDLDPGTFYKYRAYAKVGDKVYYGGEVTFKTQGVFNGQDETTGFENTTDTVSTDKILHNGQLLILRGDKIYTIDGRKVK